jgi:hypothetical protein
MHRQWHRAWALADSAAVRINDSAKHGRCSATNPDLDSGRSKACEAVTLAACVLAMGNWRVGEHANAVAAVLGTVIGNCDSFLCGEEVGQNMG